MTAPIPRITSISAHRRFSRFRDYLSIRETLTIEMIAAVAKQARDRLSKSAASNQRQERLNPCVYHGRARPVTFLIEMRANLHDTVVQTSRETSGFATGTSSHTPPHRTVPGVRKSVIQLHK